MSSANNDENPDEEMGGTSENGETMADIAAAQTDRFEFGKGYDISFFQSIREKYQGRRKKRRRTQPNPMLSQGIGLPSFPIRPALWLDFKKRKGTCSSRRTSIHDAQLKTAMEDGMDHFTLSASKNSQEWSTDVSGYGNLANEFMRTPECHAAVDVWTGLVKKHQLAREKDPEWMAHHKEAEVQRKKKRVETIYGKSSGRLASPLAEDAVLNHTMPETTLSNSSREATETPSTGEATLFATYREATLSVSTRETTLPASSREATPSLSMLQTTLPASSREATPSLSMLQTTLPASSREATHFLSTRETTLPASSREATPSLSTRETILPALSRDATPSLSMLQTTLSASSREATHFLSTRETTLPASSREASPSLSTRETTLPASSCEVTPSLSTRETTLSASSREPTPSVPARRGRAPPNTRGNRVTGAGRGNGRGSLLPTTSAERPIVRQVRGVLSGGEGTYNVAYCYQSTYYALKPNSNPPQFFFITKGTLPPQYKQTIQLHEAPLMAKF